MSEDCIKTCKHPRILVKETPMQATFVNDERHSYTVYKVDGCLVKNECCADYAVTKHGTGCVIVELKGRDIEKAAKQIFETAAMMKGLHPETHGGRMAGLVVTSGVPSGGSRAFRQQQTEFRRLFRGRLHARTGNRDYRIEDLLG